MPNTVCIMPWIAIDRNQNNLTSKVALTPCCIYETQEQHHDINSYWNSKEIVKVREEMLSGKKPKGCRKCWQAERNGILSYRQILNKERLDLFKNRLQDVRLDAQPIQVKFTVGNQCNLACRMCLPNLSSGVKKVWDILGIEYQFEKDTVDYTKYILENRKNIQYIDIIGGEPFYHKNTKNLLKELIRTNDNKHITLYICTNATRIDDRLIEILKQFKDVVLSISIDGVGRLQEYIRPGCNWQKFQDNIKYLKEQNIKFQIVPTLSVLSILNLKELEDWCNENNYYLAQPTIVETPDELSPHNLPVQLHSDVPEKYKKFVLAKTITADALNFIRKLDHYWKTNIIDVIPVWQKVFDNLHWQQQQKLEKYNSIAKKYVG